MCKYADTDSSESESDSKTGTLSVNAFQEYHNQFISLQFSFFNLCSSTQCKMNTLIDKSILSEFNCQGHFLVEHKTMVYLIMHGILRSNEPRCVQHRGEGMYLKSSFPADHSHTESLAYSTCQL